MPLLQVTQQAQTGELGPGAVLEGGDSDAERRCTFLELSLALAGGLDAAGLETLYKAAKPGILVRTSYSFPLVTSKSAGWLMITQMPSSSARSSLQAKDASVQKKCYKVLAYICEQRSDFLEPQFHEVLEALLAGAPASLSAAKRNRLRCLKAAILAMTRPGGPLLREPSDKDDATKLVSFARFEKGLHFTANKIYLN